MTCPRMVFLSICWISVTHAAAPRSPAHVDVFVTQAAAFDLGARGRQLLREGRLIIHRLDGLSAIGKALGQGLSKVPQLALAQVRQRLAGQAATLNQGWSAALLTDMRARQLKISSVPAVVFDNALTVYGAPSLDVAWSTWRAPQAETP